MKESTTPRGLTEQIVTFCKTIDSTTTPVFVDTRFTDGKKVNECFPNVQKQVAIGGGSIQYGWEVWENPSILIEAEFHAVWKTPNGELVDVTPHADGETKILFLPDSKRVYQNNPVDNFRLVLTTNPRLVRRFRLQENFAKLRAKHNIDGQAFHCPHDELRQALNEGTPYDLTALLGRDFFKQIWPERANIQRKDPCYCGSGKKYGKCCIGK